MDRDEGKLSAGWQNSAFCSKRPPLKRQSALAPGASSMLEPHSSVKYCTLQHMIDDVTAKDFD
jgi:hypothetical protein